MKRTLLILAILLLVWIGYAASGYVALYRLASAVEARNVETVSEHINFPRLRQGFTSQLVEAYLRITGKRLGRYNTFIAGVGTSLAEPIVAQIMSAERLIELLRTGEVPIGEAPPPPTQGPMSASIRIDSLWSAIRNSSFGLGTFTIALPARVAHADQYVLEFRITQWRWKLSRITLPDRIAVRLARELEKIIK